MLAIVSIFLCLSATSTRQVSASGGSIAMVNYYPNDGETYWFVDHFLKQTTAVNTNATVSVSIDGGPLTPMTYYGIINEMVPGDTAVRDWYTWQVSTPALTEPGIHTFQFFEHYHVWQDEDQYWAEFNAQSTVKSFTIPHPLPTSSQPTPTPSTSQTARSECHSSRFPPTDQLHTTAATLVMINIVAVAALITKKRIKRSN